jgi:hypothetical protein
MRTKISNWINNKKFGFLFKLDFVNDKQERCRIIFALMEEQHGSDVRGIRRKIVDSSLPDVSQ